MGLSGNPWYLGSSVPQTIDVSGPSLELAISRAEPLGWTETLQVECFYLVLGPSGKLPVDSGLHFQLFLTRERIVTCFIGLL